MKWTLCIAALLAMIGCVSKQKTSEWTSSSSESADGTSEPSIDYVSIQRHLKMQKDFADLGISEKPFNTCDVGYGYSRSQNCRQEYLVVINFRLFCRDTEGTISTILSDSDVSPLDSRNIKWTLNGAQGNTKTDSRGYGQILTTASQSQQNQRLRLALGSEFLYMKANEIKKVITPLPWCDQH